MLLVVLARFYYFADGWGPFRAPLNARARIGDVDNHLVRKLLKYGAERGHEAFGIRILVSPICAEQDFLTAQNQFFPLPR